MATSSTPWCSKRAIKDMINNPPPRPGLDDSGDAVDAGGVLPAIPIASAYIFFLPDNVNVHLGSGSDLSRNRGYHSFDGTEPYAITPPCGRHGVDRVAPDGGNVTRSRASARSATQT